MLKKGSTEAARIREVQEYLKAPLTGMYDRITEAAVIKYQMNNNLVADGIVGRETMEEMGILDTDLKSSSVIKTPNNLFIQKHHLPKEEYISDPHGKPIMNDYLFLHHTAGWNDPFKVIDQWGRDDRGKIATEFVIGGQNIKNGDDKYDGQVVQAFPEGMQGWHLGATGSRYMSRHSVGAEICNFGQLDDRFRTYVGTPSIESQRVTLEEAFKGYKNWHRYSDDQLTSLKKVILYVGNRDNIDIRKGLIEWISRDGVTKAFEFNQDAYEGKVKGLLLHCNVRKNKVDLFPQPELIDMLLSL